MIDLADPLEVIQLTGIFFGDGGGRLNVPDEIVYSHNVIESMVTAAIGAGAPPKLYLQPSKELRLWLPFSGAWCNW